MKFGLVGIGRWGQTYLRTLKGISGAEVTATCSRSLYGIKNVPEVLRAPNHYMSAQDMIASADIDTVIIATNPDQHYKLACEALQKRKHVICEKPCMFTTAQFQEIEALSDRAIFFTDYTNLYHKIIDKIQNDVSLWTFKSILKLVNVGNGPVRDGYSDVWDYGSHIASVIFHLFPDIQFEIKDLRTTTEGNHSLKLAGQDVEVNAVFGNRGSKREHSFSLYTGHTTHWENDGAENPLKVMLEKFSANKVVSNLTLSRRISSLLTDIEYMNKISKTVS